MLRTKQTIEQFRYSVQFFNRNECNPSLEEALTSRIRTKLDLLLSAYEGRGYAVGNYMKQGISRQQLEESTSWFPAVICDEIVEMYEWREGQTENSWDIEFPFFFRDRGFCNLEIARETYESTLKIYAEGSDPERDGVDILQCFPFAELDGGCLVLPCCSQSVDRNNSRPVMDEGGQVYFYSIESMLDTAIEWVNHPKYDFVSHLPEKEEMEIWRKYNPGIFS